MSKNTISILLLFLTFATICNSQSQLKIEVQDGKTLEPVSFATIRFKGTQRGIVADYNGQFRLPYNTIEDLPILLITALGYENIEIDPKVLNRVELNILKMNSQLEALEEVVIKVSKNNRTSAEALSELLKKGRKMLATDIVRRAVNAIPINLDNKPYSQIGYYRDYQILENKYHNLNESIIEQFDYGIKSQKVLDSLNQSVLYSFKRNTDFNRNPHFTKAYNNRTKFIQNAEILPYGGNELTLLNVHDAIRNFNINSFSFVYRMSNEFLYNHKFSKGDILFIDDEPVIEIEIKSIAKKISFKHNAKGVIKISLKDFSIHGFNYTVYDYNKLNPLFNLETSYRRQGKSMYLNYITFNNRFSVMDEDVFKEDNVIYNFDQNRFYINFNTAIDKGTVHKRDFKIRYKGRKVFIEELKIENPTRVSLQVADFDEELKAITLEDMPGLVFTIKNIYDIKNRKIYEGKTNVAYQFREFFVQEIIKEKLLNKDLFFLEKYKPLDEAPINRNSEMDIYILNTPLMERRMRKTN
ncbi:carboxypeptidase-like regulatory domain-containing protein [Winogradskyella sp. PE311]|uniref:carboxypeptidase-like regulatory domain-containing protein n=1 Tax=Winogradskyella sp. PE311 TaxID=3366943 RepID=UPI00397F6297